MKTQTPLIIKRTQINKLNDLLVISFAKNLAERDKLNFEEVLKIAKEALMYRIKNNHLVENYVKLHFDFHEIFTNKPAWMEYVLESSEFEPEDKISFLVRKLKT